MVPNIHLHRSSSAIALVLSHWEEFHRLRKRFEEIAKIVTPKGVAMFIEWPLAADFGLTLVLLGS